MRKCLVLVLLLMFSWIGGIAQDARAGVTFDVLFQDGTGHALTLPRGDPGPGCVFTGYYHNSAATGHCMDVILRTTDPIITFGVSVTYDSDNGLALDSMSEWKGVGVSFNKEGTPRKTCAPAGGPVDNGGILQWFGCIIAPPFNPPVLPAGTYRIGTLIWNTAGVTASSTVAAGSSGLYSVTAVINGNIVYVASSVVLESADVNIIPICGNSVVEPPEECDDAGLTPDDGCDASCQIEPGWTCAGQPSNCSVCGDGGIGGTEQCDDGGTAPGDGCDASCQIETGWRCSYEPSFCREFPSLPSMGPTGVTLLVLGISIMGLVITARRRRSE